MNKAKTLFVIINDYPYNIGEPFFESEIQYLSSCFCNIHIFSLMGKKHEIATRICPNNVHYYPLQCNHNRIKYLLIGLTTNDKTFTTKNIKGKRKLLAFYLLGKNISVFNKIKKIIKNNKIDVSGSTIYSYWLTSGIAAFKLKIYISNITKINTLCVSRCHGYDLFSEVMPLNYQPFQLEVIKNIDSVYSCSEHGSDYLKNKYPICQEKIYVSRLGTQDYGVQLGNDNGVKTFVTCSGLRPVKNLKVFAKAFGVISNKYQDVKWLCVGDGEEKEELMSIVKDSNSFDNCVFAGNVRNSKLLEMYKNNYYYCFVNVSKSEGLPVSIMEAISFGMPVIATNVGGNSEIVDNDNGILLSSNPSIDEIVKALEDLLNIEEKKYQKLREASRNKWLRKYNAENNYKEWCGVLNGKCE